jgi:hypothetical protein
VHVSLNGVPPVLKRLLNATKELSRRVYPLIKFMESETTTILKDDGAGAADAAAAAEKAGGGGGKKAKARAAGGGKKAKAKADPKARAAAAKLRRQRGKALSVRMAKLVPALVFQIEQVAARARVYCNTTLKERERERERPSS